MKTQTQRKAILAKLIGNEEAKNLLTFILDHAEQAGRDGRKFIWQALHFSGPSGTGKTHLAKLVAECVELTFHKLTMSTGAGQTEINALGSLITASSCDDSGNWQSTPLPCVVVLDEICKAPALLNRLIPHLDEREHVSAKAGKAPIHTDREQQLFILADNRAFPIPDIARRVLSVKLNYLNLGEKRLVIASKFDGKVNDDASLYIAERCKGTGGDIAKVMNLVNQTGAMTLDMALAKQVIKLARRGLDGIESDDIRILCALSHAQANITSLRIQAEHGDIKLTLQALEWLLHLKLVSQVNNSHYCITQKGADYLADRKKPSVPIAPVATAEKVLTPIVEKITAKAKPTLTPKTKTTAKVKTKAASKPAKKGGN